MKVNETILQSYKAFNKEDLNLQQTTTDQSFRFWYSLINITANCLFT